jgi:hypothetical protein
MIDRAITAIYTCKVHSLESKLTFQDLWFSIDLGRRRIFISTACRREHFEILQRRPTFNHCHHLTRAAFDLSRLIKRILGDCQLLLWPARDSPTDFG